MARKPANPKLWAMIVAKAKAKYSSYPNPGASNWVHKQYVNHGGQFVESDETTRKQKMAVKKSNDEKRESLATKKSEKSEKKETKKNSDKKDKGKK